MRPRCALALTFCAALAFASIPAFRADFIDIAQRSGLTEINVFGGLEHKNYILETTGNGVAHFRL